jgi:hypothetical protein
MCWWITTIFNGGATMFWNKNKQNEAYPPTEIKSRNAFFVEMMIAFSDIARLKGYIKGDPPFVPEVMLKGDLYTTTWLKNDAFAHQFSDAITCYYNIAVFSFCGGAYYAYKWHMDFSALKDSDIYGELFRGGVFKIASPVMPITQEATVEFCSDLFEKYIDLIQPYNQSLENYMPYIQAGMLSFFQLGAGIQLQSMGFK